MGEPEILEELARFLAGELLDLALDPGRKAEDFGPGAARPVGESGPDLGLAGDRPLVDIDDDDERLLGQETEAPDEELVLPLEGEFAEGLLLFEERPAPLEEAELPDVPVRSFGISPAWRAAPCGFRRWPGR